MGAAGTSKMSVDNKEPPVKMPQSAVKMPPSAKKRKRADAVKQTQLDSFFPIRRSDRQEKQKQTPKLRCEPNVFEGPSEYKAKLVNDSMATQNERLEVYECKLKGRGVRSREPVKAGHFICEYKGELLTDEAEIDKRRIVYAANVSTGSYIYEFIHRSTPHWVDATGYAEKDETMFEEFGMGRLINHSCQRPNIFPRRIVIDGVRLVYLYACVCCMESLVH